MPPAAIALVFFPEIVRPSNVIVPRRGRIDAGDQIEDRRFPGAVRTDHRDDRPGVDREVEIVDGDEPAEALRHVREFEQRHYDVTSL